jgi:hypothetical protein
MKNKLLKITGIVIFCLSFLIGAVFNGLAFWSDLEGMSFWGYPESNSFDSNIETDARLKNLVCPVLLTSAESATVRVKVSNPQDFPINPSIQASISKPGEPDNLMRDKQTLALAPGETREIKWQVGKENILFNRIIFVRVFLYQSANYPPSATAHCGIMVRDLGNIQSAQLSILAISISLIGMLIGGFTWWWAAREKAKNLNRTVGMFSWLILLTAISIITNLLGWMLAAGLVILLMLLSVLAIGEAVMLNRI